MSLEWTPTRSGQSQTRTPRQCCAGECKLGWAGLGWADSGPVPMVSNVRVVLCLYEAEDANDAKYRVVRRRRYVFQVKTCLQSTYEERMLYEMQSCLLQTKSESRSKES